MTWSVSTGTRSATGGSRSTTRSSTRPCCCPGPRSCSPRSGSATSASRWPASSIPKHAEHAFELLDADDLADTATTSDDAEESKPDPELVEEALSRLEGGSACVVGDSVWDVEAAKRAGVPAYGVLSGGTSRAELEEAGAVAVYEDARDLLDHLDDWLV